jgi:hypothetical protein
MPRLAWRGHQGYRASPGRSRRFSQGLGGGRAYIIEVPGVSLSALNDAQIATVMNWVLENMSKNHLPRDFSPYTADEVHRYRAIRLAELSKTRRALLEQLVALKIRAPAD